MTRYSTVFAAVAILGFVAASAGASATTRHGICAAVDEPYRTGSTTHARADIDGDRRPDTVSFDPRGRPCPTLSVRFSDGLRVSLALKQFGLESPWPDPGFPPRLLRVVNLGGRAGRAILVETFAGAASMSTAVVLARRTGLSRMVVPFRFGPGNTFLVASIAGAVEAVTCGEPGEILYSVLADLPARLEGKIVTTVFEVRGGRAAAVGRSQVHPATAPNLWRYGFGRAPFASCRGA